MTSEEEIPLFPNTSRYTSLRWAALACFCTLSFSNASIWISYSSIQNVMKDIYGVNQDNYDLLATMFAIVYLPLAPVGAICVEKKGLRFALILSSLINVMGAVLRVFSISASGYPFALAGQVTCAVAQAFFLSAPSKLSALYFPPEQRATSTSLAVLANSLGIAITMASPSFVVDLRTAGYLMYCELALCAVAFVLVFFVMKNPDKRTTLSSSSGSSPSVWTIVSYLKSRDFVVLSIAASIGFGSFWSLSTILSQVLIAPDKNYPGFFVSGSGTTMVVLGLLGLFLVGFLTDKTRAYREILIGGFLAGTAALFSLTFLVLRSHWDGNWDASAALIIVLCGVVGFSMTAIQPVSLEAAVEFTFPCPEEVSSGVLFWIANGIYIIEVHIADSLRNKTTGDATSGLWVLVAGFGFSFLCIVFFLSNKYKRVEDEKRRKLEVEDAIASDA